MANLEIIDQKGKSAGNVDLNEEIFGIEPNEIGRASCRERV